MKYLQTETPERGPFLGKTGACQMAQNGPMLIFFDQICLESNFNGGHFYEKNKQKEYPFTLLAKGKIL